MVRKGHSYLDLVARPEIGALALAAQPAWLWAIDGTELLWTNVAGARMLGADSIERLLSGNGHPAATNLEQIVSGLSPMPYMTELAFGSGEAATTLWCLCSRIELGDGTLAVFAAATDEAAATDPLPVRAGRLVQSLSGNDVVAAILRPSGHPVAASGGVGAIAGGAGILSDFAGELALSGERERKRLATIDGAQRLIGGANIAASEGELVLIIIGPPQAQKLAGREPSATSGTPRFTFSLDQGQRFIAVSADLGKAIGVEAANITGRSWRELSDELKLDPGNALAEILARRDTRSGITIHWPVGDKRMPIDLTVMPSFGRDGVFEGFRGFGVFRHDPGAADKSSPAPATAAEKADVTIARDTGNIVRLRAAEAESEESTRLTGDEQDAFRRIADELRTIGGRVARLDPNAAPLHRPAILPGARGSVPVELLDRLPIGIAVFREDSVLFANRALLDRLGYADVAGLVAGGGIGGMFAEASASSEAHPATKSIPMRAADGRQFAAEARIHVVPWSDGPATMLSLRDPIDLKKQRRLDEYDAALTRLDELEAVLDTATDGALVLDAEGRILRINRSAEALFGITATEMVGRPFTELLAEESRQAASDYLDGLARNGVASVLNDGREVIGRVPAGGLIPLFMTMGRLSERGKFCAVLRDITQWKNAEEELVAARRSAEMANRQKSDFLAKISHEIRTPLNAIIGFSDVIIEERFGPMNNDRYREYLRDIRLSGTHMMSLINDLLDLSKIESGKLDLTFTAVPINRVVQESVALMQPEANRRRIIIRTSLADDVPQIVADERSLRQIVLNLLSNAVKFNVAAGQVIVSTATDERGGVVLRVRDTGIGMSDEDVQSALQPFQQIAASGQTRFEGTGLGLPLTKALVEANRASFEIDSTPNQGTLVRISFPVERVLQP